jgi:hypothetical protein
MNIQYKRLVANGHSRFGLVSSQPLLRSASFAFLPGQELSDLFLADRAPLRRIDFIEVLEDIGHAGFGFFAAQLAVVVGIGGIEAGIEAFPRLLAAAWFLSAGEAGRAEQRQDGAGEADKA